MKLEMKHIVPAPLAGTFSLHPIWDQPAIGFDSGKHYLIQAASGKGKSTLLHILYGMRSDYSGELSIDGQQAKDLNPDQWAKLRRETLSMVFQDLKLFPELNGYENIALNAGLSKTEYPVKDWAEQLDILAHLDKPCGKMSFGQQQRVAILRALCQPFEFLMLDEPFSHLDEANIQTASKLIQEQVKANQAGLLLSSLGIKYPMTFDEEVML